MLLKLFTETRNREIALSLGGINSVYTYPKAIAAYKDPFFISDRLGDPHSLTDRHGL